MPSGELSAFSLRGSNRQAPHVLVKNVAVTAQNRADPVSGYAGIPRNMTGMGVKVKEGGYRTPVDIG